MGTSYRESTASRRPEEGQSAVICKMIYFIVSVLRYVCTVCFYQSKAGPVSDYVPGEDVLDIWFDSGASWAAVLEGGPQSLYSTIFNLISI